MSVCAEYFVLCFEYYSDAGDSYDYEKGLRRIVPMHWDDSARVLTLGRAQGAYPGMPRHLHIRLVVVGPGLGVDAGAAENDGEGTYDGSALRIHAKQRA